MDLRYLPLQLSILAVATGILILVLVRRRLPPLPAAALAYAITLLPIVGIFQNGQQIAADRYSYLACMSWALLIGACFTLGWQAKWRIPLTATASLVVIALGVLTWRQTKTWHDSETLWSHALAVEPSFLAFTNLGMALQDRQDIDGAIQNYRRAIELNPSYDIAHNNLGGALLVHRAWDDAVREFQTALKIDPFIPNSHNGWGYALAMQGKIVEAIPHFEAALKIDPNFDEARRNLEHALDLQRRGP